MCIHLHISIHTSNFMHTHPTIESSPPFLLKNASKLTADFSSSILLIPLLIDSTTLLSGSMPSPTPD